MANNEQTHIALVDDDPKIRELTAKYLSDQELSVKTAANGSELGPGTDPTSVFYCSTPVY